MTYFVVKIRSDNKEKNNAGGRNKNISKKKYKEKYGQSNLLHSLFSYKNTIILPNPLDPLQTMNVQLQNDDNYEFTSQDGSHWSYLTSEKLKTVANSEDTKDHF